GADLNNGDNTSSDTDTLNPAVDLRITISDGGVTAVAGETVSYTVTYANVGSVAAGGVVLTETLPANTTFNQSASLTGWSLLSPGVYKYTVGTVASGGTSGSVAFTVNISSSLPATVAGITDTASVADNGSHGADFNAADNLSSVTTTAALISTANND